MSSAVVNDFVFDEVNEEEIAKHGLSIRQVFQVLDDDGAVLIKNKRGHGGRYLLIGRDHGGFCITIPIGPTREPTVWRPVTAWPSEDHERAGLKRG